MSLNNLRANVSILKKIFQTTRRNAGVITRIQLLEDPPPKICEGQKNVQISARFLTIFDFDRKYLRNGSTYRTSEKKTWSATTLSALGEKNLVNFGPHTKKFCWLILTYQRTYFSGDYISAIRWCCALKFCNILQIDQGNLAHTQAGTGVPPPKKKIIAKI